MLELGMHRVSYYINFTDQSQIVGRLDVNSMIWSLVFLFVITAGLGMTFTTPAAAEGSNIGTQQ